MSRAAGALMHGCAHLDDIRMVQFAQVLDFAHGGHVKAVLKLAHLDLLDGNLATRRELSACCVCMLAASTQ